MRYFGLNWQCNWVWRHVTTELSSKERDRLRALLLWQETKDVALTCRTFGLSRATLYRWLHRFDPHDLSSLRDRSRRPRHLRQPQWPLALQQAIVRLREQYPRWGKNKLVVLLHTQGFQVSGPTVGRILRSLRHRGQLLEPKRSAISAKRRRKPRPYAVRKPHAYQPRYPGDLVQLDTLDIRPLPGIVLKQFTARDVVSRWDVLAVHTRSTSTLAAQFLDAMCQRFPFPLRAV